VFRAYYRLAKPGIIYGNLLTACAGYLMASRLRPEWKSFIAMAIGLSLVIGSACVLNNLYDRDIDKLMARTKNRPSVSGEVSMANGLIYAIAMAVIGFGLLIVLVNNLTAVVAAVGFVVYVVLYSYSKRKTHYATLIGSISGAAPIVGGYVAFSGAMNSSAWILGLLMVVWQMPHFYAIAIFRSKDYKAAKVPVLSVVHGDKITSYFMIAYSLLFVALTVLLYRQANLGLTYLIVMLIVSLGWLVVNIYGLFVSSYKLWARKSFLTSLIVLLIMSVMVAIR